ncbi:MAG: hypothetical protein L6V95_07630 [Candidatus Melainabacteria bacterium]|nr:MAG: hypothetical protein L6V95_07630 [Candidatus Melainabacteria bacterium]
MEIYQSCRTSEEINQAFDKLQAQMDEQIKEQMKITKQSVINNFDEDINSRLKIQLEETRKQMNRYEKLFWNTTKIILKDKATFDDKELTFKLNQNLNNICTGNYYLISKTMRKKISLVVICIECLIRLENL